METDTTLVDQGDGRFKTKRSPVELEAGRDAGDDELIRLKIDEAHSIAFGFQGAKHVSAQTEKNRVTYRGILPGVNLELAAAPSGVKEDIVLSSPNTPREYVFPLRLEGLSAAVDPATGDVVYKDAQGVERARTPHGYMEDSNVDPRADEGSKSSGVTYEVISEGNGQALKMTLDRAWLSDPTRMYPVRVDPSYWLSTDLEDDTYVMSGFTADNAYDTELKVGTYDGGSHLARSYMNFDVSGLNGKVIESATLQLYNIHSWSCQARGLGVYRVTQPWGGHTMTGFPGASYGDQVAWASFAMGYEPGGCGDGWAGYDVKNAVANWTNGTWGQHGPMLAVDSVSEADNYAWKKFASWNYSGGGGETPHIDIWWSEPNRPPNVPVAARSTSLVRETVQR